ncbi:hypothetical protein J437_LFUL008600 [Ladona fulva]|uniref:Uncharacterized protein n=1 Tax=Ladona fulva TaxID=123851 RepID=A0A8K0P5P2_LADFU|nr:hypothetical protein J437_LFUL008600 [Ladona fulva]
MCFVLVALLNQDDRNCCNQLYCTFLHLLEIFFILLMIYGYEIMDEIITKMYEGANREKEAMVMRYATSERDVIEGKKEREAMDKKIREMTKEREILLNKVKAMNGEKARICLMLDGKCNDLAEVQKENEKLKEELNLREVKLKWTQNKLKAETDCHKETKVRLDNVSQKLQSYEEEIENVRRESQEMVRAFRESQENRAFTLDQQLKEQQAQLIMERHEKEDKEGVRKVLQHEIENFKAKQKVIIEENNLLSVKVQKLEKERLEYEQNLSNQKRVVDEQRQQMADLSARLTHMESLQLQLQHEHEKVLAAQGEVERLRQNNAELQQEMSACREREAELLAFTQRLTDKNVWLQSEFSATEAKAQQLESEQKPLRKRLLDLESELQRVRQSLETEHQEREEENRVLARHLAERTQRVEQLERDLEDSKGELNVLKRRQAMTIKVYQQSMSALCSFVCVISEIVRFCLCILNLYLQGKYHICEKQICTRLSWYILCSKIIETCFTIDTTKHFLMQN